VSARSRAATCESRLARSAACNSDRTIPDLGGYELANEAVLAAVRHFAFTQDRNVLRAADFQNLGSEEPGSVHESVLELHSNINAAAATVTPASVAGSNVDVAGSLRGAASSGRVRVNRGRPAGAR
jgi:hypothetical protein